MSPTLSPLREQVFNYIITTTTITIAMHITIITTITITATITSPCTSPSSPPTYSARDGGADGVTAINTVSGLMGLNAKVTTDINLLVMFVANRCQ